MAYKFYEMANAMNKKRQHKGKTEKNIALEMERIFSLDDHFDFLSSLDSLIPVTIATDPKRFPKIVNLVDSLHALILTTQGESVSHYLIYYGEHLRSDIQFLLEIKAVKGIALLERILELFLPFHDFCDKDGLIAELEKIDNDETRLCALTAMEDEWNSMEDDILALIRNHLTENRKELENFLLEYELIYLPNKMTFDLSDDEVISMAYSNENSNFAGFESNLLAPERLPLLIKLASDRTCPSRSGIYRFLYAIAGSVGVQILDGKTSSEVDIVQCAIKTARESQDDKLHEWARRAEEFILLPTPELALEWMGNAFTPFRE